LASVLDTISQFLDTLGPGSLPIPPKSDTLGAHVPDLTGVPRDGEGIICQLQSTGNLDGGDSAHRTGAAAFCNSAADQALLPRFEKLGIMVRHPTQPPWNDPTNCSRDQLKGYSAGCWRAGRTDINQRLLLAHEARGFVCQNIKEAEPGKPSTLKKLPVGDVLLPDDVMCLHVAAGQNAAFMDIFGQLCLHVAIEVASRDVTVDKNNLLYESIICGRLNLFVKVHQNYESVLRYYWGDQRNQPRMAEEIIWVVKQELKRYPVLDASLLPANTLDFLRSLDLNIELKNIDQQHLEQLAERFAEATLKDAVNTIVVIMKLGVDIAVRELQRLGATVQQTVKALADIHQPADAIGAALKLLQLPADQINHALGSVFPGVPPVLIPPIVPPIVPPIPGITVPIPGVPLPDITKPPWKWWKK
jgi:hypothetical protein